MTTTFTLNKDDLPAPGETVEVDLGDGLVALVENTNEPLEEEEVGPLITYTAVETVGGATVTHAAAVHQRLKKTRVERYTLCSRQDSRRVQRRKRDLPVTAVTCVQCRKRLESEGVL